MTGVLSSEWLKLRSVRSTYVTLAVAAAGVPLAAWLAWYAAGAWDTPSLHHHVTISPTAPVISLLADLCLGVLGVLAVTSEYSSGTIRTSLVAVPGRPVVLAAKAAVVAAVALVAGEAIVFATELVTRAIIGDRPMIAWIGHPASALYAEPVSQHAAVLLCLGLTAMLFAVVGLGLGTLMRSATGAIACIVALMYVIPLFAIHLPAPWAERVMAMLLPNLGIELAGQSAYSQLGAGTALPPAVVLAGMLAYVAVSLGAAAVAIQRRDA
jgi:ABC-2 type transport system permease protein